SFLRQRYVSTSRQYSAGSTTLPNQAQPVERQVRIDVLNRRALARDDIGQPAGREHDGVAAAGELGTDPPHQAVDHLDVAEDQTRLHGVDGVPTDRVGRLAHVDAPQPG